MSKTYLGIAPRGRCFPIDKKNCLTSALLVTIMLIISLFSQTTLRVWDTFLFEGNKVSCTTSFRLPILLERNSSFARFCSRPEAGRYFRLFSMGSPML